MLAAILAAQLVLTAPRVIDADTLRWRGEDYRLAGIDAPETRAARCLAERALGEAAALRVQALIDAANTVTARPAYDPRGRRQWPRDGFRRRLARVDLDGVDLAGRLVAEGHARPWSGHGPRPDWCAAAFGPYLVPRFGRSLGTR